MINDMRLLAALQERVTPGGDQLLQVRDEKVTLRGVPGGHTRAGTVNDKTFTSDAMVSTRDLDRYDTVLEPDGWQLGNYQKNPVVFFNHCDDELPVGKSLVQEKQSAGLWARTLFAASLADCPEDAKEVWAMHRAGFLNAWSVSFWPTKWEGFSSQQADGRVVEGVRFTEMELLEYSLVGLPGNPNTITLGLARVALASASRFGCAIPDSCLPGDLGLVSRAAQLAIQSPDLVQAILQPEKDDPKMAARVNALRLEVARLSSRPGAAPEAGAVDKALARIREAGAVLRALK